MCKCGSIRKDRKLETMWKSSRVHGRLSVQNHQPQRRSARRTSHGDRVVIPPGFVRRENAKTNDAVLICTGDRKQAKLVDANVRQWNGSVWRVMANTTFRIIPLSGLS